MRVILRRDEDESVSMLVPDGTKEVHLPAAEVAGLTDPESTSRFGVDYISVPVKTRVEYCGVDCSHNPDAVLNEHTNQWEHITYVVDDPRSMPEQGADQRRGQGGYIG